jgi:hypothetical protein
MSTGSWWALAGIGFLALILIEYIYKTIVHDRQRAAEATRLAELKRQMIDRGMTAEQIERVIHAAPPPPPQEDAQSDPDVLLSSKMAEHDVPIKVMEEIFATYRSAAPATRPTVAKAVASMLHFTDMEDKDGLERILIAVRSLCLPAQPDEPRRDERIVNEPSRPGRSAV